MTVKVYTIPNETALAFLRENKARKECVFVRPCDVWYGAYINGALVGVGGYTQKARYIEIGGMFVKAESRNNGIGRAINCALLLEIGDRRIVAYARPIEARILRHFGFMEKHTLKNGTIKLERG